MPSDLGERKEVIPQEPESSDLGERKEVIPQEPESDFSEEFGPLVFLVYWNYDGYHIPRCDE